MKYDVHLYAVVRVKVPDIEAASQQEAIQKAEEQIDLNSLFPPRMHPIPGVECVVYAEEIDGYLVDEVGDSERERSQSYDSRRRKE